MAIDTLMIYVISLCDRVREVCPEFPAMPQAIHWSIRDPARDAGTDHETLPASSGRPLSSRLASLSCWRRSTTSTFEEVGEHA